MALLLVDWNFNRAGPFSDYFFNLPMSPQILIDSGIEFKPALLWRNIHKAVFFARFGAKAGETSFVGTNLVGILDFFKQILINWNGVIGMAQHIRMFGNPGVKWVQRFMLLGGCFVIS